MRSISGNAKARAAVVAALVVALVPAWSAGASRVSFSMRIAPTRFEVAIPGQRIVALVRVRDAAPTTVPVQLSAVATHARVTVRPSSATDGDIVEVTIVPRIPGTVHVAITGERGTLSKTRTIDIDVWKGKDGVGPYASQLRDRFVAWLSTERPELGIGADTAWKGTVVWPYILGVTHYLFFSDSWEMGLSWHIMIPPYDWATIYLRPRTNAMTPRLAFQIPSVSDATSMPQEATPPDEVTR